MELVYLWVEKYKNIEKQGFNFSPRFTCKYDEINQELTIDENKEYASIFPENINVTAIVGKNGSGKSSLLQLLEGTIELKNINRFVVYQKDENYYCEFKHIKPDIVFDKEINYIDNNDGFNENSFFPRIIRIAHNEKVGEDELSHYYFGNYSGLLGGMHVDRQNFYNMLDARFFVPRYINIATDHIELFEKLKQMYKFDTLRLLLKNNSTSYIRKWINNQIATFGFNVNLDSNIVCIYEKTERILERIQKQLHRPIEEIEIHLYDRNREKIVSILENIENMHRDQTYDNQIKKFNKYQEFDLAVLIAFTEYYLKNTDPCNPSNLVYETLLELKDEIKNNAFIHENVVRLVRSYILDFFQKLKDKGFKFLKDDFLTIDKIIESINYVQQFKIHYFDSEGNPYIDIPIDVTLKENLHHIKILQKIFFDNEFDEGNEKYLRVFEYDLINNKIGSSYKTISDGEKHFIRFSIDVIYYLEALKNYNFTPEKESLALFLADEPDNAMHPIWKKKLMHSVLEILSNYSDIPNIKQHFVFTTHSPFLLSDIPKQNIIFLDTYDDGRCKVLKHNEVINKKQTFGANIHTLLSDSFFMEDGLMGEFAKSKINEVIALLLKEEQLSKDEIKTCKQIISIIGEPILQKTLEHQLNEKINPNETELQKLEREKEEIQEKIKKLRKNNETN